MDYATPLHCQNCGTMNDPRNTMTGVPACASCGLTSTEGAFSMQDELSKLFERGMTFTPMASHLPSVSQHRLAQSEPQETPSPEVRPVIGYSASQHYIPVTRPLVSQPPEGEQALPDQTLPLACQQLLIQHGILPDSLGFDQRSLFLYATPDQRARLIDLWTACSQGQDQGLVMDAAMDHDVPPVNVSISESDTMVEPYIRNGYGIQDATEPKHTFSPLGSAVGNENEYKRATDPAYQDRGDTTGLGREWWRHGDQQHQPSEFQYGMFEAMRQFHIPIEDDEML